MAISFTVSYTFAPSTTIASAQVNSNFSDNAAVWQGLEALTKTFARLKVDVDPTTPLEVATKQYVDTYGAWRRPYLNFVSATTVDVEANTGTANQTKILFPDGNARSVTEDTASSTKYRRFDITATAEFTSGTEESGLRSGLSEANNTFYAIYAVKSLINTSNFVLAGDTTYPIQANFSTLNSRYGTNSWVYLGLVVNGNNSQLASSLMQIVQNGNFFRVVGSASTVSVMAAKGLLLATQGTPAASLSYGYSSGTALPALPSFLTVGLMAVNQSANAGGIRVQNSDANADVIAVGLGTSINGHVSFICALSDGVKVLSGDGGNETYDIFLEGWWDPVLGVGSNPLI